MNTVSSRHWMENAYLSAIHFSQRYGVKHYNLGLLEHETDDVGAMQANLVRRLIGSTPIDGCTRLIDVGSGIGGAVYQIARDFKPRLTVGVELSWPNLLYAREQGSGRDEGGPLAFVQADAQLLPLGTASADVIFNLESAWHYPDKDAFLRGCRRVLKPGGKLLIGDLLAPRPLPSLLCRSQCAHFWSPERYHRAVTELGFKHVTIEDVTPRVLESIRRVLGQTFRSGIRHWWSSRRSIVGVCGAWFLLGRQRLRYLLIRAEA